MTNKIIFTLFILLTINSLNAQKVKGNKIVVTEQKETEGFYSIIVHNNFEIELIEDTANILSIEADSNLQEQIDISVVDSTLTIKTKNEIKRAKSLKIRIAYNSELKKIILHNKVTLKSLSEINSSLLRIEAKDNSHAFLSLKTNQLACITDNKAELELHATSDESFFQVNENSELKGIINAKLLKVDLYQKGETVLEGDVTTLSLRADTETKFYGHQLNTINSTILVEGESNCYIRTNEEITIDAKDKSRIYLMGEPKVLITGFANETTLYKKEIDYNPYRLLR